MFVSFYLHTVYTHTPVPVDDHQYLHCTQSISSAFQESSLSPSLVSSALEEPAMNGTALDNWSTLNGLESSSSTCLQYTRNELIALRNSSKWIPHPTYVSLKDLGIFHKRSRRAGKHIRRKSNNLTTQTLLTASDTNRSLSRPNISDVPSRQNSVSSSNSSVGSNINICLWNARSIRNKTITCSEYILEHDVDAMFLTESWLKVNDDVVTGETTPPGFSYINIPKDSSVDTGNSHGGLGIIFKNELRLKRMPSDFCVNTFEHVLIVDNQRKILYALVYRPPPSTENQLRTADFLSDFDNFLIHVTSFSSKIILLGDFNVHVDVPDKADTKHFITSYQSAGFYQHVSGPTHKDGHTLDLFLSIPEDGLVLNTSIGPRLSDHHIIDCNLSLSKVDNVKEIRFIRNLRNVDRESLNQDLSANFNQILSEPADVDKLTALYNDSITDCLDTHAPITKRSCSARIRQPWFNSDIQEARRERRRLERRWRKSKSEEHHELYISQNKLND